MSTSHAPRDVRVRLVVEVGGYPLDYKLHVKSARQSSTPTHRNKLPSATPQTRCSRFLGNAASCSELSVLLEKRRRLQYYSFGAKLTSERSSIAWPSLPSTETFEACDISCESFLFCNDASLIEKSRRSVTRNVCVVNGESVTFDTDSYVASVAMCPNALYRQDEQAQHVEDANFQ